MIATKGAVLFRIRQYDEIGKRNFLDLYARGYAAISYYLIHNSKYYDLKALYAAACEPPIKPATFNTQFARKKLEKLGFRCIAGRDDDLKEHAEGMRSQIELAFITDNSGLITAAKEKYQAICEACSFDFSVFYGEIGIGFIECHLLDSTSQTDSNPRSIAVHEVTVLCSNCHRMVHRTDPPLTVEALKERIAAAREPKRDSLIAKLCD